MDYSEIQIESTLPKPWEEEHSFNDILYDWMSRAPWLAISAAAHLLVFFILMAIPWDKLGRQDNKIIEATLQQTPEEIFEEPEEEIVEEEIEEEPIEEPVLKDAEVEEVAEDVEAEADTDFMSDSPFDSDNLNDVIGIGGGAGGKFGGRFGKGRGRAGGGSGTEQALKDGLEWLKNHQDDDGMWDCDGFNKHCPAGDECDMPGYPVQDVGITGLALLAFLGDGNTTNQGPYKDVVSRGVQYLRDRQDPDTGLFGESSHREFLYGHSIATLAICEAYFFSKSPLLKRTAQKAIDYIARARNDYGAWRYDVPPIGDNDTSVTGWMIFALASAKDAGLRVDTAAFDGALSWFDEVTDPASGRMGYNEFGSFSSRTSANQHYPEEKGEAMTAVGLLCRFFLQQDPSNTPIMEKHADLMLKTLPEWDPQGFGTDMYYWYYGSYAMFQMGGTHWKRWNEAMKPAVLEPQRKDGHFKGSWDPIGPWGYCGGRVYSTALMTLCLEVYFRYAKIIGSR